MFGIENDVEEIDTITQSEHESMLRNVVLLNVHLHAAAYQNSFDQQ